MPIVCDMTSSVLTKPINWSRMGVVYASTAKQAGIANVCITVVRNDLIGKQSENTPSLLSWETYKNATDTFPNTPNTWGIYMCGLTVDYMLNQGGLGEMNARALARSTPIYEYIDKSGGFYTNSIGATYRSRINITFRIRNNEALETKFAQEAQAAGLIGLAGHSWVGACRITLNNHMPFEGVYALIDFMQAFKASNQ